MYYFFLFLVELPLEELGVALLDLTINISFSNFIQLVCCLIRSFVQAIHTYHNIKQTKNKDA